MISISAPAFSARYKNPSQQRLRFGNAYLLEATATARGGLEQLCLEAFMEDAINKYLQENYGITKAVIGQYNLLATDERGNHDATLLKFFKEAADEADNESEAVITQYYDFCNRLVKRAETVKFKLSLNFNSPDKVKVEGIEGKNPFRNRLN